MEKHSNKEGYATMKDMSEAEFKEKYHEIISAPLPEDPEKLDFLYERIITLIQFTVERAEYYENIRQDGASTSNNLVALALGGLGLVFTVITGSDLMYHPAIYLFVPPLLVLLIGGAIGLFKHHIDSDFQYPHQKYDWIEERWYFKKSIPAHEKLFNGRKMKDKETQEAFLSDLEKEFETEMDIDKKAVIPKDKANLVILYIVTGYKKKFAKFVSKLHTWVLVLAGLSIGFFAVIYAIFVLPFIP